MLHAPRFGQKIAKVDSAAVNSIPGVRYVVEIPNGVAVIATTFWAAKKGRDALKVEWDPATGSKATTEQLLADYRKLAATPGKSAKKTGDAEAAIGSGAKKLDATYEFPFLAHAAMEPMNCVVKLTRESCEIWNGEQFQTGDQMAIAKYTGLKPEQVKLNMMYAGGSFGRRASSLSDYVLEAVSIAVQLVKSDKVGIPVKLVWTREDDMRGGFYRPMYVHALRAAVDADGKIAGWHHRIVGQSILAGTAFESMMVKDGIDLTSVEGASTLPYDFAHMTVELHTTDAGVPVLWWRSVGSSHTAFSTETFFDELASLAGKDPVAMRRDLLAKHPRHLAALNLAADKAGWSQPLAAGKAGEKRGRGIAVHESFGTVVAQVAEVTVDKDNKFKVDRVVCAVDCGVAVNPDNVRSQMEGGIGFGLTAALYGKITVKDGAVEQSNFHDYPLAAHQRDAGGRGAHRPVDRQAHRRRRARRAADRAGGGQRAGASDGQALARASAEPRVAKRKGRTHASGPFRIIRAMDAWIPRPAGCPGAAAVRAVDRVRRRARLGDVAADGLRAGGRSGSSSSTPTSSGRRSSSPPRATPSAAPSPGGWGTARSAPTRSSPRIPQSAHPRALQWLERFGPRACLLSWLPVVGDPLCAVADGCASRSGRACSTWRSASSRAMSS